MICIFSSSVDISTTDVIRWLHHLGKKDVIRINYNDPHSQNAIRLNVTEGDFFFDYRDKRIYLHEIEAVWYRKGRHWLSDQFYPVSIENHAKFTLHLNNKLGAEETKLAEYLHFIIENTVPVLGTSTKGDLNKLLVLHAAREVGFLVPKFHIANHKENIREIFKQSPELITKAMSDGLYLFEKTENKTGYFTYTEKVDKEETLVNLPDRISPSFFQESIDKKFELRVFFLADKCYSMAILSQADEQTKVDFRRYNEKKPNRNVPYKLSEQVENKIKKLFYKLGLNTGSVDLLVDQQEKIYFLEINPVGQFGWVSEACNYSLEKLVATNLIEHARKTGTN